MIKLRKRLDKRKFEVHLAAFLLIVLPSAGMYFAAEGGAIAWIYALLGLVILGNLVAMSVP